MSELTIEVIEELAPAKRTGAEEKPNRFVEHVAASYQRSTPLVVRDVIADEESTDPMGIKVVKNEMRTAARRQGLGLTFRAVPPKSRRKGKVDLQFQATEKRERKYTSADVREWAAALPDYGQEGGFGPDDLYPRVKPEVSKAYKMAHGLSAR